MESNKPFFIETDGQEFENHIADKENENGFPFEFSKSNVWNSSFFTPENSSNTSFDTFYSELIEIKQLVKDIKIILSDVFEIKTKDCND